MIPITPDWTLFLDRDGVLNVEKEGDYIRHAGELQLLPGVAEAMALLAPRFRHVIVVTNQKGIGKGLMTETDLADIHAELQRRIAAAGGRIDRIYHCPDTDASSPCRKPNAGMGRQAMRDFPGLDPLRSVMVGNTLSDMGFGRALGSRTVFVDSAKPRPPQPHPWVDHWCEGLWAFAKTLINPD
jgi:histidinol-phosphate phosphatase family protein